ncbi:hypothetical protein DFQ27_003688 [Actinomortierella ambigua]|uniref:WD40 repeat-like protein n=1 Tax=Actinomortierella ambigua TaxID=1343610 RepID=A0A9P6U5H4_9FUNG|nr:hypothetical protein DFQ27_003688 [Actinomortierella ambigua]
MSSRDTRIEDRGRLNALHGTPLLGMPTLADGATNRTDMPGPQDLIPVKRRKHANTASMGAKRFSGGERSGFSFTSSTPLQSYPPATFTSVSSTPSLQQQRQGSRLPLPPPGHDSPTTRPAQRLNNTHRTSNKGISRGSGGSNKIGHVGSRGTLAGNGRGGAGTDGAGGGDRRGSSVVAGPIIVISDSDDDDDDDDFQTQGGTKRRLPLLGSEREQAIEIPSSSSGDEDFVETSGFKRRATPLPASSRQRKAQKPLKPVNGPATGMAARGTATGATSSAIPSAASPVTSSTKSSTGSTTMATSATTPLGGKRGQSTAPPVNRDATSRHDQPRRGSHQPQSQQQHHRRQQEQQSQLQQQQRRQPLSNEHNYPARIALSPVPTITLLDDQDQAASGDTTESDILEPVRPKNAQPDLHRQQTISTPTPAPHPHHPVAAPYQQHSQQGLLQDEQEQPSSPPQQQQQPLESSAWTSFANNFNSFLAVVNKVNRAVVRAKPSPSSVSSTRESSSSPPSSSVASRQPPTPAPQPPASSASEPIIIVPSPSPAPTTTTLVEHTTAAPGESLFPDSTASSSPPTIQSEQENMSETEVLYEVDFDLRSATREPSVLAVPDVHAMDVEGTLGVEDYHYDDDHLLGGELELPNLGGLKARVDYTQEIQGSYTRSQGQLLRYQQEIRSKNAQWRTHINRLECLAVTKDSVYLEQMRVITEQVAEANRLLRRADWDTISRITSVRSGENITPAECKAAFEAQYSQKRSKEEALKRATRFIPIKTSSLSHLLTVRALGSKSYNPGYVHDLIQKAQAKTYRCATSFNYGSGSIVDMAMKRDGTSFQVLVGSIATQDIYNRSGNLLLCDFNTGLTTPLTGHEVRASPQQDLIAKTVNDVKLSYSKRFFISASDDMTSKIWKTGTGELVATQNELCNRVTRVAVCEAGVMVYGMDRDEDRVSRQSIVLQHNAQRCVSCISFGQGYYWNILAVGMEGIGGIGNGQVVLYDAYVERPSARIMLERQTSLYPAASVSCFSFSSSGEYLLCGTSGGSGCDAEDNIGDGLMRLFDIKTGKQIAEVLTHQEDVNLVGFSPCETYVISCSAKNDIVVFDRRFLQRGMATPGLDGGLATYVGDPSSSGRRKGGKAATRRDTAARRVETKPLHSFFHSSLDEVPTSGISSALWWPSGPPPAGRAHPNDYEGFRSNHGSMAWLVTGGGDGVVRAWDLGRATEDAEAWKLEAKVGPIACVMATPDFDDLVIGGDTSMVSLYTMNEGIVAQYEHKPMRLLQRDE